MTRPPDANDASYVHATALVIGECGVLIRGASGSGKSSLAGSLIGEARNRGVFARLVGDDRVALSVRSDRLVARGHPAIAGLIEKRTQGIIALPFERACVITCVVDLWSDPPPRFPDEGSTEVEVLGVRLQCLRVPTGAEVVLRFGLLDSLLRKFRSAKCDGETSDL